MFFHDVKVVQIKTIVNNYSHLNEIDVLVDFIFCKEIRLKGICSVKDI